MTVVFLCFGRRLVLACCNAMQCNIQCNIQSNPVQYYKMPSSSRNDPHHGALDEVEDFVDGRLRQPGEGRNECTGFLDGGIGNDEVHECRDLESVEFQLVAVVGFLSKGRQCVLQVVEFLHQFLMVLFPVGHLIESLDVFLCLPVYLVEFFVSGDGLPGTDLENHGHLCVRQDVNIIELSPEFSLGRVLYAGFRHVWLFRYVVIIFY
mmetsp:Transcript_26640/g.73271  ORF Transcript_26640/g.73271 Transcript_26640/m.73271 type:complete len:207 (+) Transcript_26640:323-943(+)